MNSVKVCFDVDGCLIHQVGSLLDTPKYDMIQLFHLLEACGCELFIWSGGGIDYAERWRERLGLRATVVPKGSFQPDIAIDDQQVRMGKVNICLTDYEWEEQVDSGSFVSRGD